jgi:hypothetical protein
MRQVKNMLGIIDRRYATIEQAFQGMARVKLEDDALERYLRSVFPDPADKGNKKAMERTNDQRAWSKFFFHHGKRNESGAAKATLWSAYNGVTEFIDHCVPQRSGRTLGAVAQPALKRKLDSIWFGDGYSIKARAFDLAKKLIPAE